ncbi:MAG: SCP2 sterol-binding domain-containing protein [Aquificaceae bacterium]|uniref:SCP2 sterol-binding domain-containing protein n=1 Tax=Hydrogenobacter sp. Uz 6-8 TaxID=3384828 RepID=UPI0030B236F8
MKANTEDYVRELKLLAHHIQETHGEFLKNIQEPLLLEVELPEAGKANFLISSEGIRYSSGISEARHVISISYRDLLRLVEKPSRILRYIFEGRVRIRGDYQKVLSTLQRLL